MEGSSKSLSPLTGLYFLGAAVFVYLGVTYGAGWFAPALACLLAAGWKGGRGVRILAAVGLVLVLLASGYAVGKWLALRDSGAAPAGGASLSTITAVHL